MRAALTGVAIAALIATGALAKGHKPAETKAAVAAALADPARADQAADDARRKALESVVFSGVRRGDTVVDYLPGKGYWTRIFTGVVGPKGHVYPMWPAVAAARATETVDDLKARKLANVTPVVQAGNIPPATRRSICSGRSRIIMTSPMPAASRRSRRSTRAFSTCCGPVALIS